VKTVLGFIIFNFKLNDGIIGTWNPDEVAL